MTRRWREIKCPKHPTYQAKLRPRVAESIACRCHDKWWDKYDLSDLQVDKILRRMRKDYSWDSDEFIVLDMILADRLR